jgi:hypothetical protein
MSEEFTLKEVLIKRSAVDGFEGSIFTGAAFVYSLCDDILADTRFACDEDSGFCRCDLLDLAQDDLHRCGFTDNAS